MKTAKINVTRIDKSALFEGKNGKYLDIVLWENRDGLDQYGNNGFITQDIGKERREAGEKGPIIGNWKEQEPQREPRREAPAPNPAPAEGEDDIPF
jgi:hypothetical protein